MTRNWTPFRRPSRSESGGNNRPRPRRVSTFLGDVLNSTREVLSAATRRRRERRPFDDYVVEYERLIRLSHDQPMADNDRRTNLEALEAARQRELEDRG